MAVDLLQRVGLNKYEAEAYFALLADGPLTGYELGKRSAVPLSKSYETLERLTRRGLALVQPGDPPRYTAELPERFLAQTRAEQQTVLSALAAALAGVQRADPADGFWVVRGRANILAHAQASIGDARQAVVVGLSGVDESLDAALDAATGRGCRVTIRRLGEINGEREGPAPDQIALLVDERQSLVGTLSPAAHGQAVTSANPTLALMVRSALGDHAARHAMSPSNVAEVVGAGSVADTQRGLEWLDWETRKHQRLWRSQQGGRVA